MLRASIAARCVYACFVAMCFVASCSSDAPPKTADEIAEATRVSKIPSVDELFPADLDLVVRVDVARLRKNLPKEAIDSALASFEKDPRFANDAVFKDAMRSADVVTAALRVEDLEAGDRVIALEGPFAEMTMDEAAFVFQKTPNDKLSLYRKKSHPRRDGVSLIAKSGERALWFVSPVERDGVLRVVRDGADESRGIPQASGIMSVDYRPRKLSPRLLEKFPSIGRMIGEIASVRLTLDVEERGLVIDAKIAAKSEAYAERVLTFIGTLRDLAPEYALALRSIKTDVAGNVVHVEATLPPAALERLFSNVSDVESPALREDTAPDGAPPTTTPPTSTP
jgi:hypothetical protein